jgi:uncharacterized LabA/DUF88 family protein
MTNTPRQGATLAVLIDADNAAPAIVEGLLAEVAKYGVAAVKRIYGDWTRPNLSGWKDRLLAHSIQPIQQFRYTVGKNATDSAMIIDAMDLLYTGRFDGFCIVSSDSDFTRLASRIREQGLTVYGFGERKTPKPFVTACDKFIYSDVLRAEADSDSDSETGSAPARKRTTQELRQDSRLVRLLQSASQAVSDEDGWSTLGGIGNYIAKQAPEFDSRNYGYGKLSELVTATNLFEVETRNGGNNKTLWVRLKKRNKGEGGGQPQPAQPQQQQQRSRPSRPSRSSHRSKPSHSSSVRPRHPHDRPAPEPVAVVVPAIEPARVTEEDDDDAAGSASTLIQEAVEVSTERPKAGGKRGKRPDVTLSDTPWPIDQSVFSAPGATVLSAQVDVPEETKAEAPAEEAKKPAKKKPAARRPHRASGRRRRRRLRRSKRRRGLTSLPSPACGETRTSCRFNAIGLFLSLVRESQRVNN